MQNLRSYGTRATARMQNLRGYRIRATARMQNLRSYGTRATARIQNLRGMDIRASPDFLAKPVMRHQGRERAKKKLPEGSLSTAISTSDHSQEHS
ncbi:MAG: hypothetical protein K9J06_02955 [Flavobacteriales bacterium]|nr:hypothetical protein [Flavobacteriales bacterium]